MGFTFEWHIRTAQTALLEWLQDYWWERGLDIEVIDGPQDVDALLHYLNVTAQETPGDSPHEDYALVYATRPNGWTVVKPNWMPWDGDIWKQMSWDLQAPILAAQHHSVVEQSHWAWFEGGEVRAEHWKFPSGRISTNQRGAVHLINATFNLYEAFAHIDQDFPANVSPVGSKRVLLEQ